MSQAAPPKRVVRQPPEFCLNAEDQDFTTWYKQFENFAKAMSIPEKDQLTAIISYLDTAAFAVVENLKLEGETLTKADLYKPLLEKALKNDNEKIPARLKLRYRTQKSNESLSQFALELGKLADKSDIKETAVKQQLLVDSFCTGVKDADLSIKLLENNFGSLTLALNHALKVEGANKIRNFVRAVDDDQAPEVEILATSEQHSHKAKNSESAQLPSNSMPQHSNNVQQHDQNFIHVPDQRFYPNQYGNSYNYQNHYSVPRQMHHSNQFQHMTPRNQGNNFQARPSRNFQTNTRNGHVDYQPNGQRPMRLQQKNRSKVCYYCQIPGHVIRMCHKRMRDESRNFRQGPSPRQ